MNRELMLGLLYAAIFGLAAFFFTIIGVLALKAPGVDLVYAWRVTGDAHATLIILANIGGFIFGRRAASQPAN